MTHNGANAIVRPLKPLMTKIDADFHTDVKDADRIVMLARFSPEHTKTNPHETGVGS